MTTLSLQYSFWKVLDNTQPAFEEHTQLATASALVEKGNKASATPTTSGQSSGPVTRSMYKRLFANTAHDEDKENADTHHLRRTPTPTASGRSSGPVTRSMHKHPFANTTHDEDEEDTPPEPALGAANKRPRRSATATGSSSNARTKTRRRVKRSQPSGLAFLASTQAQRVELAYLEGRFDSTLETLRRLQAKRRTSE
ncbi:hypothetical protein BDN72DRAFT_897463 [Pluteus cervinus]|uniref:Uncharacterized protein n=1 Tax=Pluteus cervinus TaxID=181527 RepID=A0ACD3AU19_9AGAR|nr:hypothetical protein BDN72DRAFT_897463 [Pluteus cervinus]